jgi:hypothetical protein
VNTRRTESVTGGHELVRLGRIPAHSKRALGEYMPEEDVPRSWTNKRVTVYAGGDGGNPFNGTLLSTNDQGVVVRIILNEEKIAEALREGEEPDEPLERLCFFPWNSVQAIMQLDPEG